MSETLFRVKTLNVRLVDKLKKKKKSLYMAACIFFGDVVRLLLRASSRT